MEINIKTIGHDRIYELENIVREVFKNIIIRFDKEVPDKVISELKGDMVYTTLIINDKKYQGKFSINNDKPYLNKMGLIITRSFLSCVEKYKDYDLPWGVLVGIRPSKKVAELKNKYNIRQIKKVLTDDFFIREDKAELMIKANDYEEYVLKDSKKEDFSLYVGIPFCPTRCFYCTFISRECKNPEIIELYLENLIKEIRECNYIEKAETLYIGGGTPTTLTEKQLYRLFKEIDDKFSLKRFREITVEAGRPDTITFDKMKLLKDMGVKRVSINPQTLNDKTLVKIGRNHTVKDFYNAFSDARKGGIPIINTDLIAGLTGEDFYDFKNSMDNIIKLDPENITIHTLCYKRGAIIEKKEERGLADSMLKYSSEMLKDYYPYYLYKQKNALDNLENTGYTKKGCECLYNMYMMGEIQNIISFGSGGVSKFVSGEKVERIRNPKDADMYIKTINDVIRKKEAGFNGYFKNNQDK